MIVKLYTSRFPPHTLHSLLQVDPICVQSFSSPSEKGSFRGSRRGPLFLDLKSANLGVILLLLCLIRRLPEALSFEDMLSFVLLCTRSQEGCEECVLPLCRLESIYLSDAVAGVRSLNHLLQSTSLVSSPLGFPLVGLDQQPHLLQSSGLFGVDP
ncbi:unnamed protein product [Brassica oleracea]